MQGVLSFFRFVNAQQRKLLHACFGLTLISSLLDGCGMMTLLPLLHFSTLDAGATSSLFFGWHLSLSEVLLLFLSILLISSVVRYVSSLQNTRLNIRFANHYRSLVFRTISRARWSYLKSLKSGYLNNMLTMAIQNMSFSCTQLLMLTSNVIFCGVYILISCYFNVALTLLSVAVGAGLFAVLRLWDSVFVQQGEQQYRTFSELTHKINEFITSIKITKLYRQQSHQERIVADLSEQFNAPQLQFSRVSALNQAGYLVGGGLCLCIDFFMRSLLVTGPFYYVNRHVIYFFSFDLPVKLDSHSIPLNVEADSSISRYPGISG